MSAPPEQNADNGAAKFTFSNGFAAFLAQHDFAILATSYQSGFIYGIGLNAETGGLNLHQGGLKRPMGLARGGDGRVLISTAHEMLACENTLQPGERVNQKYDACFVPRVVHLTGRLDAHDTGIEGDGRALFVNTRFNCIATPSNRHSFAPVWTPPFIDRIVDEDRCHLNGLAIRDGALAFATAVSRSNTIDGWRDRRADGGIAMDVTSDQIICDGLSMPHSPRWHDGKLWLLNAGQGELGYVGDNGFVPVAFCPGFLRGLSFHGRYAIVGLSKPRYARFEGLALDQRLADADTDAWCGIQIINIDTGHCAEWFRIDGPVAELYDVLALPGIATPMVLPPDAPETAELITFEK